MARTVPHPDLYTAAAHWQAALDAAAAAIEANRELLPAEELAAYARTLADDRSYATRVADLQLYLRQLGSEAAACELGDLAAVEPIRW